MNFLRLESKKSWNAKEAYRFTIDKFKKLWYNISMMMISELPPTPLSVKCLNPRPVHLMTDPVRHERRMIFNEKEADLLAMQGLGFQKMLVPCGHCIHCLISKARKRTIRIVHESKLAKNAVFITLTYSPQGLKESYNNYILKLNQDKYNVIKRLNKRYKYEPEKVFSSGELKAINEKIEMAEKIGQFGIHYCDFSSFLKRLRAWEEYHAGKSEIRFFCAFEHGAIGKRPHAHAILFNISDELLKTFQYFKNSNKGSELYVSSVISDCWKYGICLSCLNLKDDSFFYTAGYANKKQEHGFGDEISHSSKNFGVGYILPFLDDIMRQGYIMYNGVKWAIPLSYSRRYFMDKTEQRIKSNSEYYAPKGQTCKGDILKEDLIKEVMKEIKYEWFIEHSNKEPYNRIFNTDSLINEADYIDKKLIREDL